jgi:hypothetical protein
MTMKAALHDPRSYLLGQDDVRTVYLGEFSADGFEAGSSFTESELLRKLNREQRADYRQARSEGFHPVIVVDLLTACTAIEMRKHL